VRRDPETSPLTGQKGGRASNCTRTPRASSWPRSSAPRISFRPLAGRTIRPRGRTARSRRRGASFVRQARPASGTATPRSSWCTQRTRPCRGRIGPARESNTVVGRIAVTTFAGTSTHLEALVAGQTVKVAVYGSGRFDVRGSVGRDVRLQLGRCAVIATPGNHS
jgi:hypothetical protein